MDDIEKYNIIVDFLGVDVVNKILESYSNNEIIDDSDEYNLSDNILEVGGICGFELYEKKNSKNSIDILDGDELDSVVSDYELIKSTYRKKIKKIFESIDGYHSVYKYDEILKSLKDGFFYDDDFYKLKDFVHRSRQLLKNTSVSFEFNDIKSETYVTKLTKIMYELVNEDDEDIVSILSDMLGIEELIIDIFLNKPWNLPKQNVININSKIKKLKKNKEKKIAKVLYDTTEKHDYARKLISILKNDYNIKYTEISKKALIDSNRLYYIRCGRDYLFSEEQVDEIIDKLRENFEYYFLDKYYEL